MTDIIGYIASFLFVLALIGVSAWALRRFVIEGGGTASRFSLRHKEPRLSVVEGVTVDGRRRLVLIRRDNVEHLIMTGGPTDLLIETDIKPPATVGGTAPDTQIGEGTERT